MGAHVTRRERAAVRVVVLETLREVEHETNLRLLRPTPAGTRPVRDAVVDELLARAKKESI